MGAETRARLGRTTIVVAGKMKSISEWLRMSKLTGFDVVVSPHMPAEKIAVVQGGKVVGVVANVVDLCPRCGSRGFEASVLGDGYCTFCDGTEGGNPPGTDPEA